MVLGGIEFYTQTVTTYNRLIRERARRDGGQYVPVAEELSSQLECFTDACHMYTNGIVKKADILFEHLRPLIAEKLK